MWREPGASASSKAAASRATAAIYAGQPFRQVLRELNISLNQVWGPDQNRQ